MVGRTIRNAPDVPVPSASIILKRNSRGPDHRNVWVTETGLIPHSFPFLGLIFTSGRRYIIPEGIHDFSVWARLPGFARVGLRFVGHAVKDISFKMSSPSVVPTAGPV
ncbi:hypothetical protein B0H13DRAFT_2375464 [Mycena leptocephala]|nr:hypothetical protein B0H13DRAFT_2375464 [Mycena leptocephala]